MADLVSDGMIKVSWVATLSSLTAPSIAQLNAASPASISLEGRLTPDGLNVGASTAGVPNSKLSSTYDTEQVGRRKAEIGVTFVDNDQATDAVRDGLIYRAAGYLVIRWNKAVSTNPTFAIGDKVDIYPASCHEPIPHYGPNALQTKEVPMASTAEPSKQVTTVA